MVRHPSSVAGDAGEGAKRGGLLSSCSPHRESPPVMSDAHVAPPYRLRVRSFLKRGQAFFRGSDVVLRSMESWNVSSGLRRPAPMAGCGGLIVFLATVLCYRAVFGCETVGRGRYPNGGPEK